VRNLDIACNDEDPLNISFGPLGNTAIRALMITGIHCSVMSLKNLQIFISYHSIIDTFEENRKLQRVDLDNTRINVFNLCASRFLYEMIFYACNISDFLINNNNVRQLVIINSDFDINLSLFNRLKSLTVQGFDKLTEVPMLPKLKTLVMTDCKYVTSIHKDLRLNHVHISSCPNLVIDDASMLVDEIQDVFV
jgi:hypothetical protein